MRSTGREHKNVWSELKDGFDYVYRFSPVRSILLLLISLNILGVPYSVLLPVFASDVLHGGPHTLGFLTSAAGLGALASAITLAMRRTIVGLGRVICITALIFGFCLMLFGLSRWMWLSLPLMVVVGFTMMQQMSASNTIMQTIVDENKRGRVMSFYTMSFIGVAPFGSLLIGVSARTLGASRAVILGGLLFMIVAVWFTRQLKTIRNVVRPIYVRLGILPEVAEGIQAASALQTPPQ